MSTLTDQSLAISNTLSAFYKQRSSYLQGSGDDPSLSDYYETLSYDELLRRSSLDYTGAADASTAAAVEQTHEAVASVRENEIASKSRLDIYSDMVSEYGNESLYHADRAKFLTSLLSRESRVPYLG